MTYLVYLCTPNRFKSRSMQYVEISTEFVGMILTSLLMQFTRLDLRSQEQRDMISLFFISLSSALILSSFAFMIYSFLRRYLRKRSIDKKRDAWEKSKQRFEQERTQNMQDVKEESK